MATGFNLRANLTAILLAISFAVSSFMQSYQDWFYAPALGCLGAAILLSLSRRDISLPNSGAAFCILLFWALYALMFTLSTIPFTSQISFLIFCALPLGFITIALWGQDQKQLLTPLAIFTAFIFGVLAIGAIYKNLFIPAGIYGARAHFPFINPNSLATILAMGLIPFAGMALGAARKNQKIIFTTLSLLLFAGLIGTESRGGLLAAGAGLGVLFFCTRDHWRLRGLFPVFAGGFFIAMAMALISGSSFWHRMGDVLDTSSPSVIDRLSLWQSSWKMMLASPWTGTGPGSFSAYYPAFREAMRDQSAGNFSHFDALQMGAEMGIAAPILFYTTLTAILIRTIQAMIAVPKTNIQGRILSLRIMTPFAALLAVAIHAHICFPLYLMPVLLSCGILLGFWHQATSEALGYGILPYRPRHRIGLILGGGIICALLLGLAGSSALGSFYMRKALQQNNPETYLTMLAKAIHYGPASFIDPQIELARTNLRLIESGHITSPRLQQQYLDEAAALLDAAELWNPQWAEIDYLRGQLYATQNLDSKAIGAWEKALAKNPLHFETRFILAEYLIARNQQERGFAIVTKGLTYPHNLAYRHWAKNILQKE